MLQTCLCISLCILLVIYLKTKVFQKLKVKSKNIQYTDTFAVIMILLATNRVSAYIANPF